MHLGDLRLPETLTVDCAECGGNGYLSQDVADSRGEHDTRDEACPSCEGHMTVEYNVIQEFDGILEAWDMDVQDKVVEERATRTPDSEWLSTVSKESEEKGWGALADHVGGWDKLADATATYRKTFRQFG